MLDKILLHAPIKIDLLDIFDDAKYCIFGLDLLDLDLNVASFESVPSILIL